MSVCLFVCVCVCPSFSFGDKGTALCATRRKPDEGRKATQRAGASNAEGRSYLSGREEPASEAASDGARKRHARRPREQEERHGSYKLASERGPEGRKATQRTGASNAEGRSYLSDREEPASEAASDGARKRARAPEQIINICSQSAREEARQLAARERARLGSLEPAGRRPPRERHRASSPAAYRGGRRRPAAGGWLCRSKVNRRAMGGAIRGLLVYAHLNEYLKVGYREVLCFGDKKPFVLAMV